MTRVAAMEESCCTCATLLSAVPRHDPESEKPCPEEDRRPECCGRVICGRCIHNNPRFASYCPYCQISSAPTTLLPQGLKEPPSYDSATKSSHAAGVPPPPPPPYTPASIPLVDPQQQQQQQRDPPPDEKAALKPPAEDTLHFLNHDHDTVSSLSLRYGVPAPVLRSANKLGADHLLLARRTVLIPGEFYKGGVSLSPRPVEGEEEELRKSKIRRWMVGCKVSEYDVAVLYLENADYDIGQAMEAYFADEAWEREHPLDADGKRGGKAKGKGVSKLRGGTWASQAAFLRRQGPSG